MAQTNSSSISNGTLYQLDNSADGSILSLLFMITLVLSLLLGLLGNMVSLIAVLKKLKSESPCTK